MWSRCPATSPATPAVPPCSGGSDVAIVACTKHVFDQREAAAEEGWLVSSAQTTPILF
ncbi:hypothetical protein ACHGLA_11525 [Streptomyces sp. YH02]|uniref:hypothetical protein n=1 Tax=Streptomyces sp. YH02 TaxID=3256999 RepID=UPI003756B979